MYRQWCISELTATDVAEDELWFTSLLHIRSISAPWNIIWTWIFIKTVKVCLILAFDGDFFVIMGVSHRARWRFLGSFTTTFMHCDAPRIKTPLTVAARYQVRLCCLPLSFLKLFSACLTTQLHNYMYYHHNSIYLFIIKIIHWVQHKKREKWQWTKERQTGKICNIITQYKYTL